MILEKASLMLKEIDFIYPTYKHAKYVPSQWLMR